MCFVLNRASNLAGLSSDDIANVLGTRNMLQVPTAGPEVTQAVNEGRPVILHQPRSPVARALQVVAEQVRTRVADPSTRR
jgi:MinD-like ATPase involved in chromosome partitioning or flagellar assembly